MNEKTTPATPVQTGPSHDDKSKAPAMQPMGSFRMGQPNPVKPNVAPQPASTAKPSIAPAPKV